MIIHKELAASGRWFKFSLMEQLANIGCDVDRAVRWRNKGDIDMSNHALYRALELIDFTVADPKNRNHRLRELCRMRDTLKDYFMDKNIYQSNDKSWDAYFYYFSYKAALERGR